MAGGMTVMDLLDYISQNIDPSLGYYRHSVCNHGVSMTESCVPVGRSYDPGRGRRVVMTKPPGSM